MPVKRVHYDARSLEPSVGDKVEVIINRINSAEPEQVEVVYLGCVQLESFTTPYFKLLMPDNRRPGIRRAQTQPPPPERLHP